MANFHEPLRTSRVLSVSFSLRSSFFVQSLLAMHTSSVVVIVDHQLELPSVEIDRLDAIDGMANMLVACRAEKMKLK